MKFKVGDPVIILDNEETMCRESISPNGIVAAEVPRSVIDELHGRHPSIPAWGTYKER